MPAESNKVLRATVCFPRLPIWMCTAYSFCAVTSLLPQL